MDTQTIPQSPHRADPTALAMVRLRSAILDLIAAERADLPITQADRLYAGLIAEAVRRGLDVDVNYDLRNRVQAFLSGWIASSLAEVQHEMDDVTTSSAIFRDDVLRGIERSLGSGRMADALIRLGAEFFTGGAR